jgi:prevent-host-death family protein
MRHMWKVGIRELKDRHLSRAIRRARLAEEVIVTDHGVPVAKIVPIQVVGAAPEVADLIRRGLTEYRPPSWAELGPPVAMEPGEKSGVDYVREQRR